MKLVGILLLSSLLLGACVAVPGFDVSPLPSSNPSTKPSLPVTPEKAVVTTVSPVAATPSLLKVGVVSGTLLQAGNPEKPVPGAILYLGEVLKATNGEAFLVGLDKQSAPKTQTDDQGRFVFTDVPVNQYSLVLDLITSSVILRDPSSGGDLLIEVTPGTVKDIGRLVYRTLPPLPDTMGGSPLPSTPEN